MTKTKEERREQVAEVLCAYSIDERVLTLLTYALGRTLDRLVGSQDRLNLSWEETEAIRHVADWITAAVMENAVWLSRVDSNGRPLKLMKLGSLEAARHEADKAMRKHAHKALAVNLPSGAEAVETELADGYYLVRLLTPEALDIESGAMQHCIGNGAYDASLGKDDIAFYSLRDSFGKPHATIEVENGWITQCQGKQNRMPDQKYVGYLFPFFVDRGWKTYAPLKHVDLVQASDHSLHHIRHLPDNFECASDLNLSNRAITHLPRQLHVDGNLNIQGTEITELPDGLTVKGSVYAQQTKLARIGEGVFIGKNLAIAETPLVSIPDDIVIAGSLMARRSALSNYPAKAVVMGDVDLSSTPISQLPDGLRITRSLDLSDCERLEALPERFVIGGGLSIKNTKIKRIPVGSRIGRYLFASGSDIEDIGTQKVWGALDLSETPIKRLPDNIAILGRRGNGGLNLSGSAIEDLGKGLRVVGRLVLRDTLLTCLPDIDVRGELDLSGSKLRTIPVGFRMAGTMNISHTQVELLPENMEVTGALIAEGLNALRISSGVKVGTIFDLGGSTVISWADGGSFGSLRCRGADIAWLPRFLDVHEFIGDDARVASWPEKMLVDGDFSFQRGVTGDMPRHLAARNVDCNGARGVSTPSVIRSIKRVDFSESRFQAYPSQVVADYGNFRRSFLTHLPAAWKIAKSLLVEGSKLETIETGLNVFGDFKFSKTPLHRRQEMESCCESGVISSTRTGH